MAFQELPLAALADNDHNPRQHLDDDRIAELANSIDRLGPVSPLAVRPTVPTEEAYDACRRLARRGLLVGQSAGGVLAAIEAMLADLEPGSVVVDIFADGADKYWSTGMWDGD